MVFADEVKKREKVRCVGAGGVTRKTKIPSRLFELRRCLPFFGCIDSSFNQFVLSTVRGSSKTGSCDDGR